MKLKESIMGAPAATPEEDSAETPTEEQGEGQDRRARRRLQPSKKNFGKGNSLGVIECSKDQQEVEKEEGSEDNKEA